MGTHKIFKLYLSHVTFVIVVEASTVFFFLRPCHTEAFNEIFLLTCQKLIGLKRDVKDEYAHCFTYGALISTKGSSAVLIEKKYKSAYKVIILSTVLPRNH